MGENYPEKGLLKNDLELTLRGCSAGRFVLFLTVCLLKEGQMGSASGNTGNPEPGGGLPIFLLFRMAGILQEVGDKRIILLILVCPDYLSRASPPPLLSEDLRDAEDRAPTYSSTHKGRDGVR